MNRLKENVTIITGGGKGIGYGLAQAFAQEGSNLVITGRTESRLLAAKEKLEAQYGILSKSAGTRISLLVKSILL